MKLKPLILAILLALLLGACAKPDAERIEVKDAWVRAAAASETQMEGNSTMSGSEHMSGGVSAAYMTLHNLAGETDRLVSVASDAAESAEMHMTQVENDVATMRQVDSIEVPPQGETELKPGGLHIMLIGLKHELKAGDKVRLTLQFEKAGAVSMEAEVRLLKPGLTAARSGGRAPAPSPAGTRHCPTHRRRRCRRCAPPLPRPALADRPSPARAPLQSHPAPGACARNASQPPQRRRWAGRQACGSRSRTPGGH